MKVRALLLALAVGASAVTVQLAIPTAAIAAEAKPWKVKSNWRQLKLGMTKSEVESLLGESIKVAVISKSTSIWFYDGGDVTFDENDQIKSWTEPRF